MLAYKQLQREYKIMKACVRLFERQVHPKVLVEKAFLAFMLLMILNVKGGNP